MTLQISTLGGFGWASDGSNLRQGWNAVPMRRLIVQIGGVWRINVKQESERGSLGSLLHHSCGTTASL